MCSNILYINGYEVACRSCDKCIAARKHDWVSRACAEMHLAKYTLAFTLTYSDKSQFTRDGATVFRYKDVRGFLNHLRTTIFDATGLRGAIRFLCAGELGSKNQRVHWHLIIFTDHDLRQYGKWSNYYTGEQIENDSVPFRRRITWSLWDNGLIELEPADQGGISYLLKYVLKDQFNVVKSKGTMREHKADAYGSGYFRMSKQPPIGFRYLEETLNRHRDRFTCPVTLDVNVPDMSGYWHPKGDLRNYMIDHIRETNMVCNERWGRNLPQFNALQTGLYALTNKRDWERLIHGNQTEQETLADTLDDIKHKTTYAGREHNHAIKRSEVKNKCGKVNICGGCRALRNPKIIAQYENWREAISKPISEVYGEKARQWRGEYLVNRYGRLFKDFRPVSNPYCIHAPDTGHQNYFGYVPR